MNRRAERQDTLLSLSGIGGVVLICVDAQEENAKPTRDVSKSHISGHISVESSEINFCEFL